MPSFEDLPPELQLQSLSHLSAREIQKGRRTSRYFRDLIDLKSNETLLIQPGISASRARVQALFQVVPKNPTSAVTSVHPTQQYCEFPVTKLDESGNDTALLDAFRDFSALYGVGNAGRDSKYMDHLGAFARHFVTRLKESHKEPSASRNGTKLYPTQWQYLLANLVIIHLHHYHGVGLPTMRDRMTARIAQWGVITPRQARYMISSIEKGFLADIPYRPDWDYKSLDSHKAVFHGLSVIESSNNLIGSRR